MLGMGVMKVYKITSHWVPRLIFGGMYLLQALTALQ
jgi:hypothetical protein